MTVARRTVPAAQPLPTAPERYDAENEAQTRRSIEQQMLKLAASVGILKPSAFPWLDITGPSYNAVGDGSQGAAGALQSAMDDAAAFTYGGTVYIPKSDSGFVVDAALTFYPNVTIRGDGQTISRLIPRGLGTSNVISGTDLTGAQFVDFSIAGDDTNAFSFGIRVNGGDDVLIERVSVSGANVASSSFYSGGINCINVDNLTIRRCILSGNGSTGPNEDGTYFSGAMTGKPHFADILINSNGSSTTATSNTILEYNWCTSTRVHFNILAFNLSKFSVSKNWLKGARCNTTEMANGYAIGLYRTTAVTLGSPQDGEVCQNRIDGCEGTGIYLQSMYGVAVLGNIIKNFATVQTDSGLAVGAIALSDAQAITIGHNRIKDGTLAGITVSSNGPSFGYDGRAVVIESNTIENISDRPAISLRGTVTDVAIDKNITKHTAGMIRVLNGVSFERIHIGAGNICSDLRADSAGTLWPPIFLQYVADGSVKGTTIDTTVAAWSSGTTYAVGDLVVSGGAVYACIRAHTNHVPPNATYWSAGTAQPSIQLRDCWKMGVDGNLLVKSLGSGVEVSTGKFAWSAATAYIIGDEASYDGLNYTCILGHTNHVPPNGTYWTLTGGARNVTVRNNQAYDGGVVSASPAIYGNVPYMTVLDNHTGNNVVGAGYQYGVQLTTNAVHSLVANNPGFNHTTQNISASSDPTYNITVGLNPDISSQGIPGFPSRLRLEGNPTGVLQFLLGSTSNVSAITTLFSGGDLAVLFNAVQTIGADSFTQSSGATASWMLRFNPATGLELYTAAAGTAVGNLATFWGAALGSWRSNGFFVGASRIIGSRQTGFANQTAVASKADLGAAPTAAQLAQWASAIDAALKGHGILGT